MKLPFLVSAQLFPLVMTIANCLDDASASVPLGDLIYDGLEWMCSSSMQVCKFVEGHYQLYLNGFSRFWIFTGYSGLLLGLECCFSVLFT